METAPPSLPDYGPIGGPVKKPLGSVEPKEVAMSCITEMQKTRDMLQATTHTLVDSCNKLVAQNALAPGHRDNRTNASDCQEAMRRMRRAIQEQMDKVRELSRLEMEARSRFEEI